MHISVIVPSYNEFESLPELCDWIGKVMAENKFSYEVVIVDDGSTDDTWKIIQELASKIDEVKGVKFRRNYGKSAALNVGFEKAQGDVVITMDADLQDSPDEIPELYSMIINEGFDMVSGWKQKRLNTERKIYFISQKNTQKKGKLLTSHRSTAYPCYLPVLGEFSRSWSCKTCPLQI